ncbi:unnamed protein product [marine sediment metagenome]|uniref:Uncharacterized protein n=1 Tax=marine sediment metagenome TaxID=412755 RepID=X1B7E2_9ZZZZ
MLVGIKIGLIDYKEKLEALKNDPPDFCEVHFTYNNKEEHEPIFAELKKRKIKAEFITGERSRKILCFLISLLRIEKSEMNQSSKSKNQLKLPK